MRFSGFLEEQPIIERENDSGIVSWKDNQILWEKPNGYDIVIDLSKVVVIGEYTTDAGPFFDDWFICFVYSTGEWYRISIYAEGIKELKEYLSHILQTDLSIWNLVNSTEWRSYIEYPKDLEGKELFVMQPPKGYKKPTTVIQKIKTAIGLGVYGKAWDFDLTDEVKDRLAKVTNR